MIIILKKSLAGFSFIEVLGVIAVVGITTAVTYPVYNAAVGKAHRLAAGKCLMEYTQFMKRFYDANGVYNQTQNGQAVHIPVLHCTSQSNLDQRYHFSVDKLTASTFRVKATPIGMQQTTDTNCGVLSIDQDGTKAASGITTMGSCW